MFQWLRRQREEKAPSYDGNNLQVLSKLCQEHSFIDVQPVDTNQNFRSIILQLYPEENYLLIDELYPNPPEKLLEPGNLLNISCHDQGFRTRFQSNFLGYENFDNMPAYRLSMPIDLQHGQRRLNFRVSIPAEDFIRVSLTGFGPVTASGRIIDLSSSGICLKLMGPPPDGLHRDGLVGNCIFKSTDEEHIKSKLFVTHLEFNRKPITHTIVGGRFMNMEPPIQKKLDRFIAKLQREQRRQSLAANDSHPI
ncbi:flagellar brake protein [Endozoicomonas sp. SM1973]|uniref:Flagellar brake protein n=1 Tax=Spartinivicinus marinus TaxID=2994442 RepID=A0A853HWH5_9GAMM|nr:flagellar brake protein [Spartinivicinus marinus]MCX4027188.1 flagellar brake protein [Spartinivicinus marinus]NYZ66090.1 flagellar brake protein [Spartinivicinus marinus]